MRVCDLVTQVTPVMVICLITRGCWLFSWDVTGSGLPSGELMQTAPRHPGEIILRSDSPYIKRSQGQRPAWSEYSDKGHKECDIERVTTVPVSQCQVKQIVIISSVQPKQTMNKWKFIISRLSWWLYLAMFLSLSLDDGWVLVSQQLARHSSIQDSGQACQNWIVFVWENPHFILWWMNSIVVMWCFLLLWAVTVQNVCCFPLVSPSKVLCALQ